MSNEIYRDDNVYYSDSDDNPNSGKTGFAVTALVLGIVSILCGCCGLGFIAAPLSIIFGIIALAKHHGGKAMSIIGIVLSSLTIVLMIAFTATYGPVMKDYFKFVSEYPDARDYYEETGEVPDYLQEYTDPKYDSFWKSSGYDDFYGFFEALTKQIDGELDKNGTSTGNAGTDDDDDVVDLD